MIPPHDRRLLRAVLSAGSQHFSSRSSRQITSTGRGVKAVLIVASMNLPGAFCVLCLFLFLEKINQLKQDHDCFTLCWKHKTVIKAEFSLCPDALFLFSSTFPHHCSSFMQLLLLLSIAASFLLLLFFVPSSSYPVLGFSLTGLLPSRPVSSSCSSSAASLAPSSGGFRRHMISCRPKRPASPQRACREEFNSSRCVWRNKLYMCKPCVLLFESVSCALKAHWLSKMHCTFRTCWATGSHRSRGFRSWTRRAQSWSPSSSTSPLLRQKLVSAGMEALPNISLLPLSLPLKNKIELRFTDDVGGRGKKPPKSLWNNLIEETQNWKTIMNTINLNL